MQRFAIVAHRRTGSNLLVSLLNSHPDLRCYGEIFRNHYHVAEHLPSLSSRFTDHQTRLAKPAGFLEAIQGQVDDGITAWGFKLMPFQTENALDEILSNHVDRVIILQRANRLAQYSSELIAAETGQGVAGRNAKIKTAKVHFKAGAFESFDRKVTDNYEKARRALSKTNIPVFEIEYMELNDRGSHNRLCDFLEVKREKLRSGQQKRNDPAVINRFSNFKVVRTYLLNSGLNHWAVEAQPDKRNVGRACCQTP